MQSAETVSNYSVFDTVLRTVAGAVRIPVIIILILMIVFSLFCIGWIIGEAFSERRHFNTSLPELLDKMKSAPQDLKECISRSGLLQRQKDTLLELLAHPDFSREELESLADNLVEAEESHYDGILKWTETVSKLAPMAGLLGTLIPLGPGIIALGEGNTYALSQSMLIAFDTTIAGLIVAGVCVVVTTLRTRWYRGYMSDLETLVDFVVSESASEVQK